MPPKKAPAKDKKGAAAAAPEDDPVKDLKRFLDAYNKLAAKNNVDVCSGIVRRFKDWMGGENAGPPNFPVVINEPIDFGPLGCFLDALLDYRYLQQLSFWKSKIGDDGLMLIARFLEKDQRTRTLELMNCGIGFKGCTFLGRALAQNDTLVNLILDFNEIGDEGVFLLGEGMKWNSSISYLSLQYCGIGAAGGGAIGKFILGSSSVKELYLKGNALGPKGITSIAQSLAKNMVIAKLDLSDNSFGIDIESLEALRDGIESNESLTSVDLHLNSIIPAGGKLLIEVLKAKTNILEFRVYERTSEDVFKEVIDTLTANVKAAKKKKTGGKKKGGKK